jgi:valyl-tRNA synthetase
MNNIQDWCISRQLWWGHQIPAWYDEQGQVYVAESLEQAQAQAPGKTLRRDPDVLDTWYSSAMVPFSTLGWPSQTQDLQLYLPSSVLVTGYDIIFFWVARMIMMTTHFTGQVPFKKVYIHGLVLDASGKKMSKSEGNVLDPVDLIDGIDLASLLDKRVLGLRRPETAPQVRKDTEKEFPNGIPSYGADALRFTFASMATLGRSINFDSKRCEGYRNFCNKLWNATRFVLMNCEGQDCGLMEHTKEQCQVGGAAHGYMSFSQSDRWIASQLQRLEQQVEQGFADFRLDIVANAIYDFVWNEFCDWYLEIAKVQLQGGELHAQRGTRRTLIRTLETILRLLHPIIPFITEELWQIVAPVADRVKPHDLPTASVSIAPYPKSLPSKIDEKAEQYVADLKSLVETCRNLRGEMGVSPATKLPLLLLGADERMKSMVPSLKTLAKLSEIKFFDDESAWSQSSESSPVAVVGAVRMCLFMQVDAQAERARLGKEIDKIQIELGKAKVKLSNEAFVAKAPAAVIEQERKRMADFEQTILKLTEQLSRLPK